MTASPRTSLSASVLAAALLCPLLATAQPASGIEPTAGAWRTWVISSGADYRVPPPPAPNETWAELRTLSDLVQQNDTASVAQIAFWDAGSPGYRWMDVVSQRLLAGTGATSYPHRVYNYLALAIYDTTIAVWESKYFYDRRRPSQVDRRLQPLLPVPDSPSYPSEHAAVAAAAAAILGHFFPAEAKAFDDMATEAGWSRVRAGVQYPSDYEAGRALGQKVAAQVIAKADLDGSSAPWTGTVPPPGPCTWRSLAIPPANPGNVTATGWRTLLLSSADQFRPPLPPACDSAEGQAQVAAVKDSQSQRNFTRISKAFYWQMPDGLSVWPYRYADKWMFEDGLDRNPPRAARVYALLSALQYDAFIASQDGKFAYWYPRPPQLDPSIVPLFAVPNFPSYPSNHSTFSAARAEMLAYLFPTRADAARAIGTEAGESRIWAGIHYPMDNVAGVNLGHSVAALFIDWAKHDGSQ
jgi:membrane-associated phospholipid phosphatase